MRLPDGTILMHGSAPYDPVKAHEYYIKNRSLKGRKKGAVKPVASPRQKHESFTVTTSRGSVKLSSQQLAEQKAYAAHRVSQIEQKLVKLNDILKKKMATAKKHDEDAKKPKTAAEKHKEAQESKKSKSKHKTADAAKAKKAAAAKKTSHKPDVNTVAGLKETIAGIKKSLHAAIERQRSLNSATKNG